MKQTWLCLTLCAIGAYAQDVEWERSFGGRQAEYLFDLQPTADYGFILAGSSLSQKSGNKTAEAHGDLDFWICKMDEHGAEDWQKSFGGAGSDMLMSIRNTPDGGFILGGTTNSPLRESDKVQASDPASPLRKKTDNDYYIVKLNAKGNLEWDVVLGGMDQDDLLAVVPTRDGGYIAGGSSASDNNGEKTEKSRGNMDYWVVKLDRNGKVQWQRTFGGRYADLLRALVPTADGGYLLAGYSNSPAGKSTSVTRVDKVHDNWGEGDFWLVKIDEAGDMEWQQTFGGDQDDELFAAIQTQEGDFLVGGASASGATGNKSKTNRKGSDIWLLKLDAEGNLLWQETYDVGTVDFLCSIVENDDKTLLLGGYARGEGKEGINDYIAIKTDEKGEELWRRSVGSDGQDILKKAIETRDGGYVLAGTSNPEAVTASRSTAKKQGKTKVTGPDTSSNIAAADQLQNEMDGTVSNAASTANDWVKQKTDKLGQSEERSLGGLKVGGQLAPTTAIGAKKGAADTRFSGPEAQGPKPNLKQSREKKANYGNRDFWIVKLHDKDKKEKERKTLEAFPNPAVNFTNIIVGFDYTKGTLSLFDLGGHQLQSFAITERTVPLDMARYPEGIYIVNVKTDKGEGSIKIMKGNR